MAVPAAAVTATRRMAVMYLGETVGCAIRQTGYLADIRRSGADDTGGQGEHAGRSQDLEPFRHFNSPKHSSFEEEERICSREHRSGIP
jgi:hypothetical protein